MPPARSGWRRRPARLRPARPPICVFGESRARPNFATGSAFRARSAGSWPARTRTSEPLRPGEGRGSNPRFGAATGLARPRGGPLGQIMQTRRDNRRSIRARTGPDIVARSWATEAAVRMLQNNLDPRVAEAPEELVVYGGIGRAARDWESYDRIVETLERLEEDETLLVQSGKPVGVFRTHADAPRVLIANSNLVPKWATWEHFHELDRKGLMMYGQMTAGSWIYIGSQGIVQGTYETFVEAARQHFGGSLAGRWILTAGLGGMGGAQPLAASFAGASSLVVECRQSRIDFRLKTRYLDEQASDIDDALARLARYTKEKK